MTTNLSIDFLRKPPVDDVVFADCRLVKLGQRLAVGDVAIFSTSATGLVGAPTAASSAVPVHDADALATSLGAAIDVAGAAPDGAWIRPLPGATLVARANGTYSVPVRRKPTLPARH